MSIEPVRSILFVSDMKRMANFYNRLIGNQRSFDAEINPDWNELLLSSGKVFLALHAGRGSLEAGTQVHKLCFSASSEYRLVESVEEIGGRFSSRRQIGREITVLDFNDPEGNMFSIEVYKRTGNDAG